MRTIGLEEICAFENNLIGEEKSEATVRKYIRDINEFSDWLGEEELCKTKVLKYKALLCEKICSRKCQCRIVVAEQIL